MESESLIKVPDLDVEAMLEQRKLKNESRLGALAMVKLEIDI